MVYADKNKSTLRKVVTTSALSTALFTAAAVSAHADEALADLVEQVAPSVVTVLAQQDATTDETAANNAERFQIPEGTPFGDLFRQFGQGRGLPDQFANKQPRNGLGSGFILDADGWIVTNHHVVEGADSVTVRMSDDREFDAEIVGVDERTDIALLRIQTDEALPYVELGDSDEIRVGEDVVAVGNPFGLGGTVTSGIVSAKGRNISAGPYAEFIQTDAAINKGNSGGPLFNNEGEVIGVNSAIYSPTGGSVGVGFAVTSNIVELIVEDLKEDGQVDRGWLGVSIQDVTPELAAALGMDDATGALVSSVVDGSPSEGKLQAGDVILAFNGEDVPDSRALPKLVAATENGTLADITLHRSGEEVTEEVQIGELRSAQAATPAAAAAEEQDTSLETFGATVAELTDGAREEVGISKDVDGVVVTSLSASGPAATAGVQVGDVIVRLGDQAVNDPSAMREALASQDSDPALLLINRAGQQLFVAVEIA